MKITKVLLFAMLLILTSCEEECPATNNPACEEIAPTNEVCAAYFSRWFYDESTKSCEEISYSGCSEKGFGTKEACETCLCNND